MYGMLYDLYRICMLYGMLYDTEDLTKILSYIQYGWTDPEHDPSTPV
jgi:hypothetical protein